jgi:hypothetical protein
MQTKYKYIEFFQVESKSKTSIWECRSEDNYVLGVVKWYGSWRQYCYFTNNSIYHNGCLRDIAHFMDQLMEDRKQQRIIDKFAEMGEAPHHSAEEILAAIKRVEEVKNEDSL